MKGKRSSDSLTLSQLNLEGQDKVTAAVELIQTWEPLEGYYLSYSGGKDSQVLKDLAVKAGVKYEAHYHPNPIDPPEIIRFIRDNYPEVICERPVEPFWKAFAKKGYPLRKKRWCCEYIKEWGGSDCVVLLGLRSDESKGRSHRCFVEQGDSKKKKQHKTRFGPPPRTIISPMLKWTENDVWQYIRENHLPYVSLYDEGFRRLGCVMCPMANPEQRLMEYYRFPKIALAWREAFQRLYRDKIDKYGIRWPDAESLFWWWMDQADPNKPQTDNTLIRPFNPVEAKSKKKKKVVS